MVILYIILCSKIKGMVPIQIFYDRNQNDLKIIKKKKVFSKSELIQILRLQICVILVH